MPKANGKKAENLIIALLCVTAVAVAAALGFDYYHDLNDDVLMKDILSGAYTGEPESHNIQMLYLLSLMISLLYRITAKIPWYGAFLCLCQFGSMGIIICRSLSLTDSRPGASGRIQKILIALSETLFFTSLMFRQLVFIQYTITVAFLSGAAILWFMTSKGESVREFVSSNIPAMLLLFLGFLLRSEMLLLMLPFVCVAGVCRWTMERKVFEKATASRYLSVIALILGLLFMGFVTDKAAYSSPEWKDFLRLFDARTELYDFQTIPPYKGNEAFYESISLKPEERILLENYNYGFSDRIDADLMEKIAAYAKSQKQDRAPVKERLLSAARDYRYRLTHVKGSGTDSPLNLVLFLLYGMTVFALLIHRPFDGGTVKGCVLLLFLFGVRTAIWLYMMLGERMPDRITSSLYLIEFCVLLGFLIRILKDTEKGNLIWGLFMILLIPGILILPRSIRLTREETNRREDTNAPYVALYEKAEEHPERFYLLDVYSSVAYSEKIFGHSGETFRNVDIPGGWACFSPLQQKKLAKAGLSSIGEALPEGTRVSYLYRNDREGEATDYLIPFYRECRETELREMLKEPFTESFTEVRYE